MNATYEVYEVQYEIAGKKQLFVVSAATVPHIAVEKADWFVGEFLKIADATQVGIRHITHINVL